MRTLLLASAALASLLAASACTTAGRTNPGAATDTGETPSGGLVPGQRRL